MSFQGLDSIFLVLSAIYSSKYAKTFGNFRFECNFPRTVCNLFLKSGETQCETANSENGMQKRLSFPSSGTRSWKTLRFLRSEFQNPCTICGNFPAHPELTKLSAFFLPVEPGARPRPFDQYLTIVNVEP